MIYAGFEIILVPEDNKKEIQMSLILANIKNILLVIMVMN